MSPHWQRIKRQLLADKRKLTMMLTLAGFAMLLWGRLLLRNVPRTAVADPKPTPATARAGQTGQATGQADKPSQKTVPVISVNLYERVTRDLFRFHDGFYPHLPDPEQPAAQPAKSAAQTTDEQQQQRLLREAVRQAAGRLKLQSTLLGRESRALINGQLVAPGQMIDGFKLVSVEPCQVTVSRDGVEVIVEMGP